jgi:hypothetical protein
MVKLWTAFGATPLSAVTLITYAPPVPAAGVPLIVAVPSPLSAKLTPVGTVPVRVIVGVGEPVVVTVKDPAVPTEKGTVLPLVIAGPLSAAWAAGTIPA